MAASNATTRNWDVREYRDGDIEGVRALFEVVFGSSRPREYFAWKYHDNPAGKALIVVAEAGDRIVGQFAMMPTRLRVGDESVNGAQSLDVMNHPDYRNQGMFLAMAKMCHGLADSRGLDVRYGLPAPPVFRGFVERPHEKHVGDVPVWTRLLNPAAVPSMSPLRKRIMPLGARLLPWGKDTQSGVEVREEKPSDDEWVLIADGGATGRPCRVGRSSGWLRWRFDPGSGRRYRWFTACRGGRPTAWAVYGTNGWGETPAIDLAGADRESLEAVASRATRRARESGLGTLIAVTNEEGAMRALKACGYLQRGTLPLVVRTRVPRLKEGETLRRDSWRITSEDSDVF